MLPSRRSMPNPASVSPVGMTVYYWAQGFVLLARTFVLDRAQSPYHRLSVTLLIAFGRPFVIEIGDGSQLRTHAALVAPKVLRRRITAVNSDIAILDLAIDSPEFAALAPVFRGRPMVGLEIERFAHLRPLLGQAAAGTLSCQSMKDVVRDAVKVVCGELPKPPASNPHIGQVRRLLRELPLREVRLETLARRVHLSPSRLRHLFKETTGSSLTQYARWASVWHAATLWVGGGKSWTEVAQEAGFYDLAHLDRAFNEFFGLNPSAVTDPRYVTLLHCPQAEQSAVKPQRPKVAI